MKNISKLDLEHIAKNFNFSILVNTKIFLTGGTGFFGKWILQTFDYANKNLQSNCSVTVLTRNAKKFTNEFPEFQNNDLIHFLEGDIQTFNFPAGKFDYIIHAATDPNDSSIVENPINTFDTITLGTRRLLDFAVKVKPTQFLLVSSGAVYGRQPPEVKFLSEEFAIAPLIKDRKASYAEGKRVAEFFSSFYEKEFGISFSIARCFAFLGAYLPLDQNYVAGNFIKDILENRNILIKGDGSPVRSYLYMADLIIWLLTILTKSKSGKIYNVGSEVEISVLELANKLKQLSKSQSIIEVIGKANSIELPERYIPSVRLAERELDLKVKINLEEALLRTYLFFKETK
jgi:nucleoside-diphosphate-sugar epimerase